MSKCPVCNKNHRNQKTAWACKCRIENEYGHYIILCVRENDAEVTEEKLMQYDHIKKHGLDNFRKTRDLRDKMNKYFEGLKE